MKFSRRIRQDIDVNMMPLIDVVFLLLIFFMVSTTFTKESRLGLNLPQTVIGEDKPIIDNNLEVVINAKGNVTVAGVKVEKNNPVSIKSMLKEQMIAKLKASSSSVKPSLTITADAATQHKYVITIMDIAGQLGFSKLSITTVKKDSSD